MTLRRILCLGALASSFMLAAGTRSQAAYSYSTALTITSTTLSGAVGVGTNSVTGSSTTVTLGNITSAPLVGANTVNIGTVRVQTTNPAAQTFSVVYTDVITITNPSSGGLTGTFTINGTLSLTGVLSTADGASSGTITNLYNGTFVQTKTVGTVQPNIFTVSFGDGSLNDFFGPPTVNGALGSLGANVNVTIPEPTSLAILGTGLVGVVGYGLRRRKKA